MIKHFVPVTILLLSLSSMDIYAQESKKAKESQAEVSRAVPSSSKQASGTRAAVDPRVGEVVATNFVIGSGSCTKFDSSLDFVTSSNVSISLLSDGTDMTPTRIIPLFALDGAIYVASGSIIHASDFYYTDSGGATIPVEGRNLRIRICNDAGYPITYLQLAVRGSAN